MPSAPVRLSADVELRNRIVLELEGGVWISIAELAAALDVGADALLRPLVELRRDGHVEADGRGRVRKFPVTSLR
jgi:predicted ArsR family transcriptional regulator